MYIRFTLQHLKPSGIVFEVIIDNSRGCSDWESTSRFFGFTAHRHSLGNMTSKHERLFGQTLVKTTSLTGPSSCIDAWSKIRTNLFAFFQKRRVKRCLKL
jgi:hypothetical protein